MSEDIVIRQCAPTLAGIKTGSLFPCPFSDKDTMTRDIRDFNRQLSPKGLRLLPLRYTDGRALLYLYRPERLKDDLSEALAHQLLSEAGYSCESCDKCVVSLIRRLHDRGEFPHEIGLFLSYPPEDVKGFIDNKARSFKLAGLWKVYGSVDLAQSLFKKYKKCTEVYCRRRQAGSTIDELAVAG